MISYRELGVIARGAEAELLLADWMGFDVVVKRRLPRGYLDVRLDARIRSRRTIKEAQLLHEARLAGVPTPLVFLLDTVNSEIVMQYIEGRRLKELLDVHVDIEVLEEAGRLVGRLHSADIVHGDPTTSNFILAGDRLVLLDFGLSYRSRDEGDKAVDLHVVKEALSSYHHDVYEEGFARFLEGYVATYKGSGIVMDELRRMESRGRYKQVV